jgi:hypothetical protein
VSVQQLFYSFSFSGRTQPDENVVRALQRFALRVILQQPGRFDQRQGQLVLAAEFFQDGLALGQVFHRMAEL